MGFLGICIGWSAYYTEREYRVECPLDDYVYVLFAIGALTGFWVLRRQPIFFCGTLGLTKTTDPDIDLDKCHGQTFSES